MPRKLAQTGRADKPAAGQLRPRLGLRPWLAFFLRAFFFLRWVRCDMMQGYRPRAAPPSCGANDRGLQDPPGHVDPVGASFWEQRWVGR